METSLAYSIENFIILQSSSSPQANLSMKLERISHFDNCCSPLAYSTLADLVHHVRQALPLKELSMAVSLFSKNVHDESLPSSIQTMSCKLLLNLVECIRAKSELENGNVSQDGKYQGQGGNVNHCRNARHMWKCKSQCIRAKSQLENGNVSQDGNFRARWKCNSLRKCKPYVEMYVVVEMLVKVEIQVPEETF